jgi:tRNA1(Val) A37 N6-methylase TrmN6
VSFAPEELTHDAFLNGRVHLWQPRTGYRAATDPVLLAAFVPAGPGSKVLELGCGVGTAALCLKARVPGLDVHGLELQPAYAELARRNAKENRLPVTIHDGDLRRCPAALRQLPFDFVMVNPPYHRRAASGSPDPGRDRSNREGEAVLSDWISAGLRRLRPGGLLVMIHQTARLGEILTGLHGRAGATEVLPVAARHGRAAARILVRAKKNRHGPLTLWPPLTLHEGSTHTVDAERYTKDAQKLLRGMAELLPNARLGGIAEL